MEGKGVFSEQVYFDRAAPFYMEERGRRRQRQGCENEARAKLLGGGRRKEAPVFSLSLPSDADVPSGQKGDVLRH